MLEDIRKRANDKSIEYVSPEQYQDDVLTLISIINRYETALKEITRWYGFDGYRINYIVKEALEKE